MFITVTEVNADGLIINELSLNTDLILYFQTITEFGNSRVPVTRVVSAHGCPTFYIRESSEEIEKMIELKTANSRGRLF